MGAALPQFFTVVTSLCLALVFYALWRSLRALLGSASRSGDGALSSASDREALLNEKQSLLQGLRDLEQERDVGKVSQDDFETMNARLRLRARQVLKELDAQVAPYRDQAEALVKQLAPSPAPKTEARESTPAPVPTPSAPPTQPTCPKCEAKNEADAVFCKKCGHRLADVEGVHAS